MRFLFALVLCLVVIVLWLNSCASTAPTPTTVGSQTTLLVQGAEIALEKNPALLARFQNACVLAGTFLINNAASITADNLENLLSAELSKHGIDPQTVTSVVKIAVAEFNSLLAQYNFVSIQGDAAKVAALYAKIQPYLIEIGKALQGAAASARI